MMNDAMPLAAHASKDHAFFLVPWAVNTSKDNDFALTTFVGSRE